METIRENKKNWKVLLKKGKVQWWSGDPHDEEKENWIWKDTLTYNGFCRGRSSIVLYFLSEKYKTRMEMFMVDFNDIALLMYKGTVTGEFTFCKRGQNYGVQLYKEEPNG